MKTINIPIKKLHPDAVIPFYARQGDAGMDLVAVQDVTIEPGSTKIIPTGLAMAIPPGYELQIRPRSGLSANTRIRVANSPGTIDSNYRGEIGVIIDNIAPKEYQIEMDFDDIGCLVPLEHQIRAITINKGDRIAQAVLAEVPQAIFQEVDDLDETNRGAAGYGSSGSSVQGFNITAGTISAADIGSVTV